MSSSLPLEVVASIASTSATLKELAEQGSGERALLAVRQTGGTGRLGRVWTSAPGNLHLSVLVRPDRPVMPGHWSLLVAVALADCVSRHCAGVGLKWPNDVLLHGGKLAGILLDLGGDPPWLVIGVGVNLVEAPPALDRPVACLRDHVPAPEPEHFARDLLDTIGSWRNVYARQGFEPIRRAWLVRGPEPGAWVTVNGPDGRIEGPFKGIGPEGGMLIDHRGTERLIVAGEVG